MAEKKVLCPECDKEVVIKDGEGICGNCGLDVGWCLEKVRRDKAVKKLTEPEVPKKKNWRNDL